ncbi:MAG: nitroreductase family protein [Oscillospiraceae bacterium]|nr:nitroreductase family protein [Oscillospiraceae bacterium]
MEFSEVVKKRYSCKKFDGRPVEQERLDAILEAGRLAPTAKNLQEQRIYVVQSAEGLAKVDKITPCRYGAATVLAVAFDKSNVFVYPGEKRSSGVEDASIVATHMMLAACDAGVDSCWLNFFDPEIAARELGLPENEEVLMLLDLGYAAEGAGPLPPHSRRKELAQTVAYM